MKLLRARLLVLSPTEVVQDGALLLDVARVARVVRGGSELRRVERETGLRTLDLGEGVLAPGLVNAHAHLELSGFSGRLDAASRRTGSGPDAVFRAWIDALIELRRESTPRELEAAARDGADLSLATGTTTVGDIDATGAAEAGLAAHPLRVRLFRELLDAGDPRRAPAVLDRARRPFAANAGMRLGLAPHAPYTVSPQLLEGAHALAAAGEEPFTDTTPITIHWAETGAEREWMSAGTGALSGLLTPPSACSRGRTGLDLIEAAGLLGPRTSLVHANDALGPEIRRIQHAGASVVHCPGSHLFFGREPFALGRFLERGIDVALGTDSLASNAALDMRREMELVRTAFPGLAPEEVFAMGTIHGARAVGLETEVGALHPGFRADFAVQELTASGPKAAIDELTAGGGRVASTWVDGSPVYPSKVESARRKKPDPRT